MKDETNFWKTQLKLLEMNEMKLLEKIVQTLIINGTLTEQPGLFYGKTGIAVFFFHYARYTDNELFQNYAMELIDEIQKQITVTVSARYDVGLAGIGAGFEYFMQNGFLEAEDDDIFEDFDARMYRAAMYEPYPDLSLEGGLTGWGRYFICRLRGKGQKNDQLNKALAQITHEIKRKIKKNAVPENEQPDVYRFLHDVITLPGYADKYGDDMQRCMKWKCIGELDVQKLFPYMSYLQRLYTCQTCFNINLSEEIAQEWKKWKETENNILKEMGLLNGWTAEGLLYLTGFHQQDVSWFNLL